MSDWTQDGRYVGNEIMTFIPCSNYNGDIQPKPVKFAKTKKTFEFKRKRKDWRLRRVPK